MALLLDPLFSPKSVAVIGASANQDRTGYKFTHELLMRFPGKVFPINPKGGEVDGRPMYKSMAEAGEPADLALILVNKKAALAAVTDCAVHGVKVGVMYTAGFGEMGEEGARIQQEMVRVANEHGMRLVGPNCMGVFSHPAGLNLTGEEIPGGDIALISQSGNIGFSLWYDAANYLHTGFSRFVGFGNQADIAVHEYIVYCADDPMSKIIVIYLEGLRPGSGLDFIRSASAAAKKKKAQKNSHSLHITNDSRRTKNCPAAVWHILLSLHLWRKKKYGDRAIDSSAVSPARHHAVSQTYREYRCKQAPSSLPYWRR